MKKVICLTLCALMFAGCSSNSKADIKEGKAENNDVTSGCTIRIDGFLKAVKEAEKNAK